MSGGVEVQHCFDVRFICYFLSIQLFPLCRKHAEDVAIPSGQVRGSMTARRSKNKDIDLLQEVNANTNTNTNTNTNSRILFQCST